MSKTYAQLTEQTDLQDTDLLAAYRSTGPLKRFNASVIKTFVGATFLNLDGSTTMTGPLVAAVGSEGSPGVVFAGDADTGFWHPAANTVAYSAGGVERWRSSTSAFALSQGLNWRASQDVASATTTDLGAVTGNVVRITGTTTITAFGTSNDGVYRFGTFAGALTLTHNATSLILPGGANITTAAGDCFEALSLGSGNWRVIRYTRATGKSVVNPAVGDITGLGSNVATWLATPSSANLGSALTDKTGTGVNVFATSPTLVTPALGTPASGVLTNTTGLPISTGLTGAGTGVLTFLATPSSANLASAVTDETGSGALVFATSPTLVTPALGTPASGVLTNATGLPISTGLAGAAAGILTFLGTPTSANLATAVTDETGSGALVFATSPTLVTPILGTPTSATLTNATGLPISTGVSGLGTGVATFLATPSSANLLAALTTKTGTGSAVFATSPTLVTPALGTPSSATLTNATGLPVAGITGLGTGIDTFLATTYVAGTWTPTVTFSTPGTLSVSYASQVGRYVRIGPMVFLEFFLQFTPTLGTASGTFRIGGLPLSAGTTNGTGGTVSLNAAFTWTASRTAVLLNFSTTSTLAVSQIGSAVNAVNMTTANITDGVAHTLFASFTYEV